MGKFDSVLFERVLRYKSGRSILGLYGHCRPMSQIPILQGL